MNPRKSDSFIKYVFLEISEQMFLVNWDEAQEPRNKYTKSEIISN